MTYCSYFHKRVPFRIYDCNEYEMRGTLDMDAMWRMAYMLERKNGVLGFIPPKRRGDG